jgi:hypothetical protein
LANVVGRPVAVDSPRDLHLAARSVDQRVNPSEQCKYGSAMITSNLPFSKWESILEDPTTKAAASDRLVHHSVILELNVPSYRLEDAQRGHATSEPVVADPAPATAIDEPDSAFLSAEPPRRRGVAQRES